MINLKKVEDARANLINLKPETGDEITIKAAVEKLRPEINKSLKAGLSYKQIAVTIYDSLGLTEIEAKREQFWRAVCRFHKPSKKAVTKPSRKPARPVADDALYQTEEADHNDSRL